MATGGNTIPSVEDRALKSGFLVITRSDLFVWSPLISVRPLTGVSKGSPKLGFRDETYPMHH